MHPNPDRLKRHCMVVFNEYPLGETRVQREAEALLKHGFEVDVICKRIPGQSTVDDYKGVRIFREKFHLPLLFLKPESLWQRLVDYFRFFVSASRRLNALSSQKPYDSIHVDNLPDFLVFCTSKQKRRGVPVILDLHDLMPEFFAGRFGSSTSLVARLIRWQERQSYRYADHVITVSEHWRRALIARGVPAEKCSVLLNVADTDIFHAPPNQPLKQPADQSFRLIYHGSMVQRYGLDLAVQAIDRLRTYIPGIHLTLVGQGEFLPQVIKLVNELNLQAYVDIEPKRLAEDLPNLILSHDLGLVPYRNDVFTDGLLPTKLMEYAALGLPVVASHTTAICNHFTGMNVEFFEPGDVDDLVRVIQSLYSQPAHLTDLRNGCQKYVAQYNWSHISSQYVALINQLIQARLQEQVG
jgi:glycosyltransferase involved in cell wall biosynthesis